MARRTAPVRPAGLTHGITCALRPAGLRPADILLRGSQTLQRLFTLGRVIDRSQGIEVTGVGLQ